MEKVTVELCMGSSCFARGNSQALTNLESYISENNLEDRVELVGHLCLAACANGPNLKVGDTSYSGVSPDVVVDLLADVLSKESAS